MTIPWVDDNYESFDFETSGVLPEYSLQPWRVAQGKAWATSFVTVFREGGDTFTRGGLNPDRGMLKAILQDALEHKRRMVGWNTVFDIGWLLAYDLEELVMELTWLDGMLLWKHATVEPEYDLNRAHKKHFGLKSCVAELWPEHAGYETEIDFHDPSPEVREKLHRYNTQDTYFTLKAAKHWWGKLTKRQQDVALIEAESFPIVAQANLHGIPVDTLVARELQASLVDTIENRRLRLAPLGITEAVARSPAQLQKVLFDDWGLPVLKLNPMSAKTGVQSRSTDKEVLHELALGVQGRPPDPRIACFSEYRGALNNKTKFADAVLNSVDYNEDGCTHPLGMVFSTYTGRLTYASKQGRNKDERQIGFAIHQEKRDKTFRKPLAAPPGHTIVEFDAAGQEFKWMAVAAEDTTMLSLCEPGEDAHCFMGARIKGWNYREMMEIHKAGGNVEVSGPQGIRMLGKVANLSLQYRTSPPRLRSTARVDYNIPMILSEAEHIHTTYRSTYAEVPAFWRHQIYMTKSTGYVATLAGRRVIVVGDWGTRGWAMGSTAINYKIQGTGADQKYLAVACMRELVKACSARLAWDLHDGLYWFVPDERVKEFAAKGKKILDNLPYKKAWGLDLPIKMNWDCKTGPNWGLLKDFEE